MQRRQVLGMALAGAGVAGASDRVHVGLVGCGGRGRYVTNFMRQAGAAVSAVCDVWGDKRDAAKAWAGDGAAVFSDFRKLLEHKPLDAVVVATPDHWHALATIAACQAGKDVYVEKPLAHNVAEGRAVVEAARRSGRIVQVGTQQRSAGHYKEVQELVQSGRLGKVKFVRVWNYSNLLPKGIGRAADGVAPEGVDWDMYCGPAPLRAFNPLRLGPTYRWFWDYAGGTITDFGVHRFDTVHQIMGEEVPVRVSAAGGRFVLDDGGEMPDTLQVTYEYPGFVLSYEASNVNGHGLGGRTAGMKYYNARGAEDRPHGEAYYGSLGTVICDRVGYEVYPSQGSGLERVSKQAADATAVHAAAFVECVRTRKVPPLTVENGHRATLVAHLGNIAFKTGRKLHWDGAKETFVGDREAAALLRREARKKWSI
ncbi:MAG: Gfo/Idh/MocA family oxidoreductase [Bryobacteraceae bacterium]|nr:Gfo/Idh/MocA family oxidoreductase [Bryobacteraceae bacterium]